MTTAAPLRDVYRLGDIDVRRMGFGAMQLAGPGVFGPPKDRQAAVAIVRDAVESGVNHIDTADFYGPAITNQIIREAVHPYPPNLLIATKVGVARGTDGSWNAAQSPFEIAQAVHDNLRNLRSDALDLVNLRVVGTDVLAGPSDTPIEAQFTALAELQRQGLIRHLGLSNVTSAQVSQAQKIARVASVQNLYNIVHRQDDNLVDKVAREGIAYVPFFPLGGFSPIQSEALKAVAASLHATPMQVALAWLLERAPNILLIPGTSNIVHLRQNLAAQALSLPPEAMDRLNRIAEPVPA